MNKQEKSIEVILNKVDDEKSTEEYMIKEKEKEKNALTDINDFNQITYVEYELLNHKNKDIDFLFDYSKILGPDKNDTKVIQWQMLNKDRLFPYGIDIIVLTNRINEAQKKGTNKMNNIISNLNYRLQRHGRLAPTKDIARKLQKKSPEEQMPLIEEEDIDIDIDKDIDIDIDIESYEEKNANKDKEKEKDKNNTNTNTNTFYNGNEENFYDINDPFIDDNLDEISDVEKNNKLLFNLSLEPGNYTESEILQNLKKRHRVKKFKKLKGINSSQKEKKKQDFNNMDNDSMISAINDIINKNKPQTQEITILSKKTKREPSYNSHNSDNEKKNKKRKFDKSQLTDMSFENVNKLFHQLISEYPSPIKTDQQKVSFINRNIKNIIEIYSRNSKDLFIVVHKEFNIDLEIAKYLVEYIIFKSKIENIYSNFSKYLKNLNIALNNNGISKITSLGLFIRYSNNDGEIEKSIKHVIDNIYNFRLCFNEYIGKHYYDLNEIHEKLSQFIKDISERNKGMILKISCKFDEIEKEFDCKISREIIIEYLKAKYSKTDFNENFSDNRNRIYSLDDFVYKDKGNNATIYYFPHITENKENRYENINSINNVNSLNNINGLTGIINQNRSVIKKSTKTSTQENQRDLDSYFNNLSFEQAISTSISSPGKYPNNKNSSKTKYIDININKNNYGK